MSASITQNYADCTPRGDGILRPIQTAFLSSLTPQQCLQRLREAVDADRFIVFRMAVPHDSKPVRGQFAEHVIRLRRWRWCGINAFQPILSIVLTNVPNGTLIACRCALHWFVQVITIVWAIGVVLFIALLTMLLAFFGSSFLPLLLICLGGLLFGAVGVGIGWFLARDDASFLLRFVATTLEAQPKAASNTGEVQR